jgi:hypothetical protein
LRQLLKAGTDIAASVFNNEGETARELVEHAEGRVFAIAEQGVRGARDGAVSVQSLMPALIDQIDEWHNNPGGLRCLPTGFEVFDRKTGRIAIHHGKNDKGRNIYPGQAARSALWRYLQERSAARRAERQNVLPPQSSFPGLEIRHRHPDPEQ